MSDLNKKGGTVGAALLIAGTCIGAGMLGMPLATGGAGFFPALVAGGFCWLLMVLTALLFLEVTLWMKDGANVLSMAERFLGTPGKWLAGFAFAFLYYCLLTAYIAGGVPALGGLVFQLSGFDLGYGGSLFVFVFVMAVILFFGTRAVDRVNWILMSGLILSYLLLISIGTSEIELPHLFYRHWHLMLPALPVLFTSYGFHNVIPSLSTYLGRDEKHLRTSIWIGSILTLVVFSVWQWVVIGILGNSGLSEALVTGVPVTEALSKAGGGRILSQVAAYFGFFALITSFLGVALSVVDFLGDGFGIEERTGVKRVLLCCGALLPPLIFSGSRPDLFYTLIGVAGGFGEAFLNGLLPAMMVWIGRYRFGLSSAWQVPGGRVTLTFLIIATLFVSLLEVKALISY